MSTVLIFGGTFDPVQNGHLAVAAQARELTGADAVWFVPAAIPPLRRPAVAPAEDRLRMLTEALSGDPKMLAIDLEIRRGGVSYTVDAMNALHGLHPDTALAVLTGADAARSVRAWHRAEELLAKERFVIVNRADAPPVDADEMLRLGFDPARTTLLEVDSPRVSASEVRRRCRDGEPISGMVPEAVARLITELGLYQLAPRDA